MANEDYTKDKNKKDGFHEVHPDLGHAGPISSEAVTKGLNAGVPVFPESGFLKCKKCGYTMNKDRHAKGWGDGIRTQVAATWDNVNWGEFFWDGYSQTTPFVTAGCPFCGTFNYD